MRRYFHFWFSVGSDQFRVMAANTANKSPDCLKWLGRFVGWRVIADRRSKRQQHRSTGRLRTEPRQTCQPGFQCGPPGAAYLSPRTGRRFYESGPRPREHRTLSFQFLFGDDRSIYAVGFSGALLWYRDLLRNGNNGEDGERGWAPNSGKQIGVGWNGLKQVFSGGDGIIYAVRDSGELLWFKDLLRDGSNGANGERGWSPDNGSQIGFGWNGFEHVFGGDNGIIYATGNGDLRWFQDLFRDGSNAADGSSGWADSHVIGGAWGNIQQVFSAGGGVIYANEYNDLFFSLDERQDGQEGELVDPGNRIGIERRVTIGTSRFEMIRGSDYVRVGVS
jgi:hypothetical protein